MRLTLRTLLAWMDGVLPPEDQRQLGEKVEGSPVARKLVERIGACVGNPQLSAPRIDGKGLAVDPDSVAEYLDNTLAPDRLEAFETICLESDMHLAEVAACHAILAEVAKHPEVLPPLDASRRRRLLEAMQHRVAAHPEMVTGERPDGRGTGSPRPEAARPPAALPTSRERHPSPAAKAPLGVAEPTAGKRTPWRAWALAGSALALLAVLAALLAQSAGLFRSPAPPRADLARIDPRPPVEPGPAAGIEAGAKADGEATAVVDLPPPDGERGADAVEGRAAGDARPRRGLADLLEQADAEQATGDEESLSPDDALVAAAPDAAAVPAEGEPAGGAPAPPTEIVAAGPPKVRAGEALAIAGGVRPRRTPSDAAEAGGVADAGTLEAVAGAVGLEGDGAAAESLGFVAADGLLLRRMSEGERSWWVPIGVGTPLVPGEDLIVPPGMHPELNVAGVSVRVLPRSRITLDAAADGTPRIGVIEGRIVARAAKADARLGIGAGGIAGTIVAGLDGAVMAQTQLAWSPGLGETPVPTIVEVIAVARAVRFAPGDEAPSVDLPARGGLRWDSTGPQGGALLPSGKVPPWAIGGERIEPLERNAVESFATRLAALPAGSEPAAGLQEVILAMAIDRRVENRVFAAILLALEGSYDVAIELLCAEEPARRLEGRQWAALEAAAIPLALARGPESAARLRKAWEDRGPAGRAELLMAMARGPDDADLAAGADATLVEALASKELVVRRYALKNLVDVVEPSVFDRARFRPEAPDDTRRDGVGWWRSLQEKGGVRRNR
jgi:hypothetical protein